MRWPGAWPFTSGDREDRAESFSETTTSKCSGLSSDGNSVAKFSTSSPQSQRARDYATDSLGAGWRAYAEPQILLPTVLLTSLCVGAYAVYRNYLRRINTVGGISPALFRKRSLLGKVTSVGDGDNFRLYHTPGGRLAGWDWLRSVPKDRKALKDKTVHVRLAGIDAPEASHFGRPPQPYSKEALDWLTSYLLVRRVRAYIYRPDQYGRVVATVYIWKGFLRRDVGLQMLRAGLATVYEAKSGAEFGLGLEKKYRQAEWWAKTRRKGMWAGGSKSFESPREYKSRHRVFAAERVGGAMKG